MEEVHGARYSIHPGATKMYHDLCNIYWWNGMKRGIENFVARRSNCQQVKAEHQLPRGITKNIDIPIWKCEDVNMDFVVGLPRTRRQYESIWVIEDRLTKSPHFLHVNISYSAEEYVKLYVKVNVKLHGGPLLIISDRGSQFSSRF